MYSYTYTSDNSDAEGSVKSLLPKSSEQSVEFVISALKSACTP